MKTIKHTIIMFWVLIPFVHIPIVVWQLTTGLTRVPSFTGNPILLAGESMFSFFVALDMYIQTRDIIFLLSFVIALFCVFVAVTDAAFLGLFIGLIFAFYVILTTKRKI